MSSSHNITGLLLDWNAGDRKALDKLIPLVEGELHRLARRHMRGRQPGHILQTTALVNEAYIRLVDQSRVQWQNRAHFFGVATHIMRQILMNYARTRRRLKRGGGAVHLDIEAAAKFSTFSAREADALLDLNEALERLALLDPRKARVVELRYFGGLTFEETAEVVDASLATIARDWEFSKSWLKHEMRK